VSDAGEKMKFVSPKPESIFGVAFTSMKPVSASVPWRKGLLFWALQTGGWLVYGLAMFGWGLDYLNAREALVSKTLLVVIGFVLTLVFRSAYRRARKKAMAPLSSAALVILVSFIGAALWREIHSLLLQLYYLLTSHEAATGLVAIPLGTLLYDGFVLLAWSLLYYGINDWVELEKQRERATKAEARAQEARLAALRSQLEPHFLFNTLNAISTLVAEGQNPDAVRMIARLSDFLRLTLDTVNTSEITVAEELEFVRRYLEIEQVRFGDRLQVTIDAQPETMAALVPALVLQPLVENAVKHGVLPLEQGGWVTVTVAQSNGTLRLAVANDGSAPAHPVENRGVGLSNTAARLSELYGNDSRFLLNTASASVVATIEIPFSTKSLRAQRSA